MEQADKKMDILGIGPMFGGLSVMYSIIMFLVSFYYKPFFKIGMISYHLLVIIAVVLVVIGITFLIISIITFNKGFHANILVKVGIYRCCRHPLYTAWSIFIVPGFILLTASWLNLTIPIFMYFVSRLLVKKEEEYLEATFGDEYLEYKAQVPSIIPYGCLRKTK